MIFDKHANLKYKYGNRHFWCRGYYVDTVGRYEDFGRNRIYLGADYQVNTNLNVYLKYGYEVRNMEKVNDGKSFDSNNYYGDLIVGWNYKF